MFRVRRSKRFSELRARARNDAFVIFLRSSIRFYSFIDRREQREIRSRVLFSFSTEKRATGLLAVRFESESTRRGRNISPLLHRGM